MPRSRSARFIWSAASKQLGGLSVDALKWLFENVIEPCGYTHVIFELNKSLRLRSHPELAADSAYFADEIRGLTRFARSLGLEIIPQQNLYGHQHEDEHHAHFTRNCRKSPAT